MELRQLLRSATALAAAMILCCPVHAQLFRAYVASDGLDTNPCTLPQPCRLLPAALTAVADGGEIWMLDSANYNSGMVTISKSVTVLAVPGALGSLVSTGGADAVYINTAGVTVTLRNLVIVHLTSSNHGIDFVNGDSLNVADCEISNLSGIAIYAGAAGSNVTVRNTVLRGSASGFYGSGTITATLDRVRISGNGYGVFAYDGARIKVNDSVLAANGAGVQVNAQSGPVRVAVGHSVLSGNTNGIYTVAIASGGVAEAIVNDSSLTNNTSAAIYAAQLVAGAVAKVTADTNWMTENGTGFQFGAGPPVIYSRGNNTLKFNTADVAGGTLTALGAQ